jgi:Amt family ammonium transporter
LANGIWGTISVGLFATADAPGGGANGLFNGGGFASLQAQLVGTLAVGAFTLTLAYVAWSVIKAVLGMRVDREDEIRGLDHSEMGMEAYPADMMAE